MDSLTTGLEKLTNLLNGGIITLAEFEEKKSVLVNKYIGLETPGAAAKAARAPAAPRPVGRGGYGGYPGAFMVPVGGKGWAGVGPVYGSRLGAVRHAPYQRPAPTVPKQLLAERGTSVKVQPVPEGIDEHQLAEAFGVYGEVVSAAVHRGTPPFGHINFTTSEAAAAVAGLNQVDLFGQIVSVTLSRRRWEVSEEGSPNRGIGIFNLPLSMTQESLTEFLSIYPGLQSVKLVFNKGSARNPFGGQFKGYAFAYFDSVENATLAKDQLTGTLVEGASLNVKFCNKAV
eukprot:EG_transcript_22087